MTSPGLGKGRQRLQVTLTSVAVQLKQAGRGQSHALATFFPILPLPMLILLAVYSVTQAL